MSGSGMCTTNVFNLTISFLSSPFPTILQKPPGGVAKGEVFDTPMGDIYGKEGSLPSRTRVYRDMDAPPSRWRDEMFDCFRHGFDHPFCWNSLCCPMGKLLEWAKGVYVCVCVRVSLLPPTCLC